MFEISPLLVTGVGAVSIGLVSASLIVWRDLGPVAHLKPSQRFVLTAVLGCGVLVFALKLAVIGSLPLVGHASIESFAVLPQFSGAPEDGAVVTSGLVVWQALPDEAPAPPDNPTTPERVALGAKLFNDPGLSRDGSLSCASCHDVEHGGAGTDRRRTSRGIDGQIGQRNAPSVYNAAFQARLFWDGRARSLEEQALGPIANPVEMGIADLDALARQVATDPAYRAAFAAAFGDAVEIDKTRIAEAIAAYERTLVTADAPYDRFVRGETGALSAQQLRGMALFERTGCVICHAGPNFSGASLLAPNGRREPMRLFPALASGYTAQYRLDADLGAAKSGEQGVWRVPSLRNVALTAPYFHNGSVNDLAEAVRIMATVQTGRTVTDRVAIEPKISWSPSDRRLTSYTPAKLSEAEVADLVAFLEALTSERLRKPGNMAVGR
jgi:cytochrome c peroxidase